MPAHAKRVGAQHDGRRNVARLQHSRCHIRSELADPRFHKPLRIGKRHRERLHRLACRVWKTRVELRRCNAAQHRIDEPGHPRMPQSAGGLDRLRHPRMRRDTRHEEKLIGPSAQHCPGHRVDFVHGASGRPGYAPVQSLPSAYRTKGYLHPQTALARIDIPARQSVRPGGVRKRAVLVARVHYLHCKVPTAGKSPAKTGSPSHADCP